ncbi:E3 ubiquitin-protein ligase SPL2-like isoform X1 [Salvia hispanica]|uniref:E3 ubiquitin-protein ligase SPL2-like isoform X1 n=1 Tax=Salvia hispanica TaxID=49212 RepID=UPI002009308A|nr:E3 ubiquitin-protein ligase SPL2-like isoform X1 [Salvia hispanica]
MSVHNRATAAVLAQLMFAADGVLFGVGVAYVAYCSIRNYAASASALRKIRDAPSILPSDLRSILTDGDDSSSSDPDAGESSSSNGGGRLVIVRGSVEVKSAAEKANWKALMGNGLVSSNASGEKGVILQTTQTCIYNEWKGVFGWTTDLRNTIAGSLKKQETSSTRMVPFILVEGEKWPQSDYVVVNMEGSNHPLPLTTVYQHLQPITATPYTFLQAICGLEYPVGMLYEEKILPLGKDITAVGICSLKNGGFEIKSSKDLPYFLSALTKDQLVADLSFKTKVLMWSGLVFGTIAIGVLGYSVARNWTKYKDWRSQRRTQQQNNSTRVASESSNEEVLGEEAEAIPDGELCVICLTRRRRSAFVPCGHLVCCQRCALSVERDIAPKCPLCRQTIQSSVRIYDS